MHVADTTKLRRAGLRMVAADPGAATTSRFAIGGTRNGCRCRRSPWWRAITYSRSSVGVFTAAN